MPHIDVFQYLMGRAKLESLPPDIQFNIISLLSKVNTLLERFGEFRKVTSGFRTQTDQMRINPKVTKSNHLRGLCVDLEDKDGRLDAFCCEKDFAILKELDLYIESPTATIGWSHIQNIPPRSKKRSFIP